MNVVTERRAIGLFLLLAFGFSWGLAGLYFRFFAGNRSGFMGMGVVYMFGPAIAAIITTKVWLKAPLKSLGPFWRWHNSLLLALALPSLMAISSILVSGLMPGVHLNTSATEVLNQINAIVPADQRAAVNEKFAAFGAFTPLILLASIVIGAVVAGATINAVAAFGEELGWRGFLQRQLRKHGFWRSSYTVGLIWGLWHLPLILRGHNYPQHPEWGVLMMVLFCLLQAPLFAWICEHSGTLLAPIFLHGATNATGGVLVFVSGGNDLLVGPTGLAGLIVLMILNLLLYWHLRSEADVSVDETAIVSEV